MSGGKPADRPYFEAWLRRARRVLAPSGRLSEIALRLSRELGGESEEWRRKLRAILEGAEIPTFELLTRIDAMLAGAKGDGDEEMIQDRLF
jgi:hypothetical protein